MTRDQLRQACLEKPGAYEDWPFGPETLVIKVRGKMFALFGEQDGHPCVSLKCDPLLAPDLRARHAAVTGAYHMNKEHWNRLVSDGSVPEGEVRWMIDMSYGLVVKGLPRKARLGLGFSAK